MALIDYLERMLPRWAIERSHWLQLGATMALMIDALIEGARDGVLAAMPGQVDDLPDLGGFPATDGHPLIGRDRGIVRGLAETHGSYATRLRHWHALRRRTGLAFGLLDQVRAVLGSSPPRVRLVNSFGLWHTVEADGTRRLHTPGGQGFEITPEGVSSPLTALPHPWDWDGTSERFRAWLIIYAPVAGLIPANEGEWGDGTTQWGAEGSPGGGLVGVDSTKALMEQLRSLAASWAPLGVTIPWIIVAFDDSSFDPETPGPYPAAGMPDGTWHRAGRLVGSDYVRTRLSTARYVRGTPR
jgi:hypothetical protein